MNLSIIPVLACSTNDCVQAEALCDHMAALKNRKASDCLVLAFASDLHAEMQTRIRIAAEIGFENVFVFLCPKKEVANPGKGELVNWLFQKTSQYMARHFKLPFLWLEPDCTPLCADWLSRISDAYEAQPKLYMSNVLSGQDKQRIIGRVGVYPRGAPQDLHAFLEGKVPFEIAAGEPLVERTWKTKVIQMLPILAPEDRSKVRPDAALLHGDKSGILLSMLRDELPNHHRIEVETVKVPTLPNPVSVTSTVTEPVIKQDGRSRAARMLKAQNA